MADRRRLSPFKIDKQMIKIIGFKLLTRHWKHFDGEQNTIPDGGSYIAKSLAGKTFSQKVEKWEWFLERVQVKETGSVRC